MLRPVKSSCVGIALPFSTDHAVLLVSIFAQLCCVKLLTLCVQRHGVVMDTCMVGSQDSAFLQQAAHITQGLYLRPKHTAALLQYLLVSQTPLCIQALAGLACF